MHGRHTKIVATLGPATDPEGMLDAMIAAGLDCARLNCSHGTNDDLRRRAADVRAAAERAGRPIGLLFDLQGPKLRLGAEVEPRGVALDETVVFCGDQSAGGDRVLVDFADFAGLVTERSEIVIGDGVPRLSVDEVRGSDVVARVRAAGPLSPRKGINVTWARPELPAITDKDIDDLALAADLGADFVALSFVRSAADLEQLRARLEAHGSQARIVAKIEKVEAYQQLDGIIEVDRRGDGRARRLRRRGRRRPRAADAEGHHPPRHPGRQARDHGHADARVDDPVAGADPRRGRRRRQRGDRRHLGGDAVGRDQRRHLPGRGRARDGRDRRARPSRRRRSTVAPAGPSARPPPRRSCTRRSSWPTRSTPPRWSSRPPPAAPRARAPSTAAGARSSRSPTSAKAANQLTLEWGVQPVAVEVADTVDDMIDAALLAAREHAGLPSGARVIVTAGRQTGTPGGTNLIMVREIP